MWYLLSVAVNVLSSSPLDTGLCEAHHRLTWSISPGYNPSLPSLGFFAFLFLGFGVPLSESWRCVFMVATIPGIVSRYFLSMTTVVMTSPFKKSIKSFMSRLESQSRWNAALALERGPFAKYASEPCPGQH